MLNITTGLFSFLSRKDCVCVFFYVHSVLVLLCLTGIPDCSEEDLSVGRALNLKWRTVLKSDEDGTQTLINSEEVMTVDDDHLNNSKQRTSIRLIWINKHLNPPFMSPFCCCSSLASAERTPSMPLPRKPESARLAATSPAPNSETGWYQDNDTGAPPSLWCIVGLVVQLQSQRRNYQWCYQSCHLSQERGLRLWRRLMTGSTVHAPGENTVINSSLCISQL